MKKLLAVLLASVMMMGVAAGCSGNDAGNDASTGSTGSNSSASDAGKDTYVIGLDPEFPPMGFKDESGSIIGFDIDLANAVAEEMGVTFEFQPIDWNSKEMELDTGRIDMIWNGFTKDAEREEKMTLSGAYLKNSQVIVVPKDSEIQSKADLAGKNVVLQKDSTAKGALDGDEISKEVASVTELSSNVDCFQDIEMGRSDAMVVDKVVAEYYLSINKDKFRMLDDELSEEEYVIGFKKGNTDLKDRVETALQAVIDSGKGKEISEEWFGTDAIVFGK